MPTSDHPRLCLVAGRDTWHIYHSRRRISTGCADRAAAERELARYIQHLGQPRTAAITIAEILSRYLENRRDRGIPGLDRLEWAHKPLARFWGQRTPEAITERECLRYVRERGVAVATVRTELQALRAALRWAAGPEHKLVLTVPAIVMPPRPESRIRWLTRAEAQKLLAACKAHHTRLFVMIGLHTGARSGAILGLTWDRVDMDQRLIDFREPGRGATKKRRGMTPINDTLFAALTQAAALATCGYVIEWAGDRVARVKHGFHDAVVRAGLTGVTPHVLRHTAVTWMLQGGVDPWQVAGFAYMTVEMVESTYGHHHPDYQKHAARALG